MTQMPEPRPCKKCGAHITFLRNTEGKIIPAQKVSQLYVKSSDLLNESRLERADLPGGQTEVWISHFQTCPSAADFSKPS